jgi:hypothetical protein
MFMVSPILFGLTVDGSKAVASMRGERNEVCTLERFRPKFLRSYSVLHAIVALRSIQTGSEAAPIGRLVSRIAGILILVMPGLLDYIVSIYLIVIGLLDSSAAAFI